MCSPDWTLYRLTQSSSAAGGGDHSADNERAADGGAVLRPKQRRRVAAVCAGELASFRVGSCIQSQGGSCRHRV